MNIEKGRSWGSLSPLPPEGVIIKTNKELLEKVNDCKRQGIDLPTFGLLGGDLWRTLGGRRAEERLYGGEATTLDIDLGCALLDGKIFWFCAHMFIGSKLKGEKIFISNVAHYGKMNPAPKAHPGDGKFDMLEVKLSPFQKSWHFTHSLKGGRSFILATTLPYRLLYIFGGFVAPSISSIAHCPDPHWKIDITQVPQPWMLVREVLLHSPLPKHSPQE